MLTSRNTGQVKDDHTWGRHWSMLSSSKTHILVEMPLCLCRRGLLGGIIIGECVRPLKRAKSVTERSQPCYQCRMLQFAPATAACACCAYCRMHEVPECSVVLQGTCT